MTLADKLEAEQVAERVRAKFNPNWRQHWLAHLKQLRGGQVSIRKVRCELKGG